MLVICLASSSVCRKSRAKVDDSWIKRCCSSRSFCQANSRRVLVPVMRLLPIAMILSSSSYSEILISLADFSLRYSVLMREVSVRASFSSSSRLVIWAWNSSMRVKNARHLLQISLFCSDQI
ncbi:hypothetical protein DAPPUDRAFT_302256 [Daphnia pulex]|uniref:Uncharacterized protein n=1 Tax=Daphnia pulex TaxID=6669 RepID=E9HMW9_DAPPU|nr:hypothetical protein DAPPUDRAFT_302256 [Daphnia pulex]|eukprot:EFX66915.1 hypothetical protein DAPPUDRAFT_302256 [Daphnia pulex]